MGPRLGPRASKVHVSLVPPWFRADSGTNLIKQGKNIKGRRNGLCAQLSHGLLEVMGSSPSRAKVFSSTVTCMIFKALGEVALDFQIKCDLVVYMFL